MTWQLLIQSKTSGATLNYASQATEVQYTTNRNGAAGKLTFSLVDAYKVNFVEGDVVTFTADNTKIFAGFVFTKSMDRWGVMNVTAYDQLRYLKANESYAFYAATLGDIITKIATDFQLTVGTLQNTGYALPSYIKENKSCFDIINGALDLTIYNTGKIFVLYDDAGKLALSEASSRMVPQVIGNGSLVTDYNYTSDIDKDTFNRIKLVRPNEETGRTDVYIYQSETNISAWGVLQYYAQVDEALNEAQIIAQAQTMLLYYNRTLRTLKLETLGVLGLNAGMMVMVNLPDLSDISLSQFVLIERATHTFVNDVHTMSLETRALNM